MLPLTPQNLMITMQDWFFSSTGRYIREWEEQRFNQLTANIFGFHAIQIGFPLIQTLKENRMRNRWISAQKKTDMKNPSGCLSVIHRFEELPFATQSIDLVVLPHVLEFAESPHDILNEVERILIPEGKIIISGFNPTSFFGLSQSFGKLTGKHFLPEYAEFISLPRLKDWLKLLGFETNQGFFGCYRPPCKTARWQKRLGFFEKMGNRWWPQCGSVYMIEAIKRVRGVRIIGPIIKKYPLEIFDNVPVNNQAIHEKSQKF